MRENGYYWVRFKGLSESEWEVAHYVDGWWFFCAYDDGSTDEDIKGYEIGERVERKEKQNITLQNKRYPKLVGKVYVTIVDSETGEEETVMAGDIIKIESTERGLDTLTVKQNLPSNLSETGV